MKRVSSREMCSALLFGCLVQGRFTNVFSGPLQSAWLESSPEIHSYRRNLIAMRSADNYADHFAIIVCHSSELHDYSPMSKSLFQIEALDAPVWIPSFQIQRCQELPWCWHAPLYILLKWDGTIWEARELSRLREHMVEATSSLQKAWLQILNPSF